MQITFDTTRDGPEEAFGLVSLLISTYNLAGPVTAMLGVAADVETRTTTRAVGDISVTETRTDPAEAFGAAPPPPPPPPTETASPPEAGVPLAAPPPPTPAPSATEPAGEVPTTAAPATATATSTTPSEDVDSAGTPWDARIHAGNRATIKDGTWRKKPGVDKATITAVEAELAARAPLVVTTAPPAAPVPPAATPSPETVGNAAPPPPSPPAAATPPPPPVSVPAVAPPPPPAASVSPAPTDTPAPPVSSPDASGEKPAIMRFSEALTVFTEAQVAGRITAAQGTELAQKAVPGAQSLADVLTADNNGTVPGAVDNFRAWLDHTLAASA